MLTIYKASAGSGKTYTLAFEYIKILLGIKEKRSGKYRLNHPDFDPGRRTDPDRHRGILAVTFTNKATEEMKTRIINELAELARIPDDPAADSNYAPGLTAEFGCTRRQLADSARDALHRLLNDYSNFNVSTIDAFFQSVLRTFAREVDCRGDYEVELNDDLAVTTGVGLMLDDLNYGQPANRRQMMRWISDYTFGMVENGKQFNVFNRSSALISDLTGYVKAITNEDFKQYAADTLNYLDRDPGMTRFRQNMRLAMDACDTGRTRAVEAVMQVLADYGRDASDLNNYLGGFLVNASAPTLTDREENALLDKLEKGFIQTSLNPSEQAKMTNEFRSASIKGAKWPYMEAAYAMAPKIAEIFDCMRRHLLLSRILKACDSLEFIGFVWRYIDRFRRENNLILLSDTTDLIRRIINGSDAPFIYERMGMRLTNFLIDEFQDTSHMQWENLRPLLANSLGDANDSLIIGDEKQSIYRWRNSDSSLLHHKVADEDFPTSHSLRGSKPQENTNYRSSHTVVRFNNTLFRHIGRDKRLDTYGNVTQALAQKTAGLSGYVRIIDTAGMPQTNGHSAAYDLTAQAILRQHRAGYRWKDIAVLVRRREDAANILAYFMKYYPEIRFSSDETLLLKNSPAVRLVISLLKLLDSLYSPDRKDKEDPDKPYYGNMADTLLMMSRFEYHMSTLGQSCADPAAAASLGGEAIAAALGDDDDWTRRINAQIDEIRRANPTNLVALVETVIGLKVNPEQRRREMPYLSALVDATIDYCKVYNPSLSAFLKWWDESSDSLTLLASSEADAINVMTIHKAKGLERPCVHVPFADWEITREPSMWFDMADLEAISPGMYPPALMLTGCDAMEAMPGLQRQRLHDIAEQQIDNINLLYVALTRAGRELQVCIDSSKSRSGLAEIIVNGLDAPLADDELADPMLCTIPCITESDEDIPRQWVVGAPTAPGDKKADDTKVPSRPCPAYSVTTRPDTAPLAHLEGALSLRASVTDIDSLDIGNEVANVPVDPADFPRSERTMRGIWLHGVLAEMPSLADFAQAFAASLTHQPLAPDTAEEYRSLLAEAFDRVPQWRDRWFVNHKRALDEQSIYDPERRQTYRPDRIIVADDGTIEVIDYKFTSEVRPEHTLQVRRYVHILGRMGHKAVRGYLWYPEKALVVDVV